MDTSTVDGRADTLGRQVVPRRFRSLEEKLSIIAEARVPGASIAAIARVNDTIRPVFQTYAISLAAAPKAIVRAHEARRTICPHFSTQTKSTHFKTVKVIHNARLADRFAPDERAKRSDVLDACPRAIRDRMAVEWVNYRYLR